MPRIDTYPIDPPKRAHSPTARTVSSIPHAVRWRDIDEQALAARAANVYPDDQEPATDRSTLRAKWRACVMYLRRSVGWHLDRPQQKLPDGATLNYRASGDEKENA